MYTYTWSIWVWKKNTKEHSKFSWSIITFLIRIASLGYPVNFSASRHFSKQCVATTDVVRCAIRAINRSPKTAGHRRLDGHIWQQKAIPRSTCGGFHKYSWFIMEHPIKTDDLGWFRGTPILGKTPCCAFMILLGWDGWNGILYDMLVYLKITFAPKREKWWSSIKIGGNLISDNLISVKWIHCPK